MGYASALSTAGLALGSAALALAVLLWAAALVTRGGGLGGARRYGSAMTRWMQVLPPRGSPAGTRPHVALQWRPRVARATLFVALLCAAGYACTAVQTFQNDKEKKSTKVRNTLTLAFVLVAALLLALLHLGVQATGVHAAHRRACRRATPVEAAVPMATPVEAAVPVAGVPQLASS